MSNPMLADLVADLTSILLDLGQACTWTPSGGAPATVTAAVAPLGPDLAGAPPQVVELYGYSQARWITATMLASDISGDPARDADTLTVDSLAYTVRFAVPIMGEAGWRLWCSREEGRGR